MDAAYAAYSGDQELLTDPGHLLHPIPVAESFNSCAVSFGESPSIGPMHSVTFGFSIVVPFLPIESSISQYLEPVS